MYYVTLIKKGLQVGESAVFNISYKKDGEWYLYRTISFPCVKESQKGDGGVKAIVLLPAGVWKFEENDNWSWKYNKYVSDEITINSSSAPFTYTFVNTSEGSTVKSDEAVQVNKLIVH